MKKLSKFKLREQEEALTEAEMKLVLGGQAFGGKRFTCTCGTGGGVYDQTPLEVIAPSFWQAQESIVYSCFLGGWNCQE